MSRFVPTALASSPYFSSESNHSFTNASSTSGYVRSSWAMLNSTPGPMPSSATAAIRVSGVYSPAANSLVIE